MKAHNFNSNGVWVHRVNDNPPVVTVGTGRTDSFTPTGFGLGDYVNATNGTFDKRSYVRATGSRVIRYASFPTVRDVGEGCAEGIATSAIPYPSYSIGDPYLYNQAIGHLYDKVGDWRGRQDDEAFVGDNPNNTDMGVVGGESRETKRMVEKAVRAARQAADTVIGWKRRPFRTVADAWLSFRYGVQPLMQDTYNLLHFVGSTWDERTLTGRATYGKETVHDIIPQTPSAPEWTIAGWKQRRCEVQATFRPSDVIAFDMARVTTYDPKIIAWELMNLSFVIDWFFDVGSFLRAQEAALGRGLTFVRGHVTWTYIHQLSGFSEASKQLPGRTEYWDVGGWDVRKYKSRSRLASWPRPALPVFHVDLGWKRIVSAWALVQQRAPRKWGVTKARPWYA